MTHSRRKGEGAHSLPPTKDQASTTYSRLADQGPGYRGLWECSHLVVPIDEDCDHLRIDALSRQQGAQHPGERSRGLSAQPRWAQAAQRGVDPLGWGKGCMVREQDLLPLGSSLSHDQEPWDLSQQVCPHCLRYPRRRLDPASQMKGRSWAMPGLVAQRSCAPWKCLPVQVVGAVPCNNSYRHIEDFIVFELEEKNVCEWCWGRPCH